MAYAESIAGGRAPSWQGRAGYALIAIGATMVPWAVALALWLPSMPGMAHWVLAWVGLDILEGAALATTGWLLTRRDPRVSLPAMVAATALIIDAWFDICTSTGAAAPVAIGMAALAEIPVAAICAVIAVRALPTSRGPMPTVEPTAEPISEPAPVAVGPRPVEALTG